MISTGTQLSDHEPRGTVVLTFDFEDWHQLVHRRIGREDWRNGSAQFAAHVSRLLDLLDDLGVSATFFVAGVTADRHPGSLREVVARGHEIGSHGYEHRRAYRLGPDGFRRDVERSIDTIERLCGVSPTGYRAPWFSITEDSRWAHDILRELGFRYDSSLFDSPRIPRRIHPVPSHPFRIFGGDDELWEFPIAVWHAARLIVPLGGGAYWRALPSAALWHGLTAVVRQATLPVLYFHPYEFADERLRVSLPPDAQPRERARETWRAFSKNTRRSLIEPRLRKAASRFRLVPVRDVIDGVRDVRDTALLRFARAGV